jgi:hypothetical protein
MFFHPLGIPTFKSREKYFLNDQKEKKKHGYIYRLEKYVNERRGMCNNGMFKSSKAQVSRIFFSLLL